MFQVKNDFTAHCTSFDCGTCDEISFLKGAFVIPFSGDNFTDALLISTLYDYNQTFELDGIDPIHCDIYLLMEKINVECDKLIEPAIAQHFGKSVRYGWPTYLEIADSGGFYTYDFLLDNEACLSLTNDEYNVYMWPYLPDPATIKDQITTICNVKDTNAIRKFVSQGGGFIGTCWGAYAASSGFIVPGVLNSLRFSYSPNSLKFLPGISLSISDSVMTVKYRVFKDLIQVTHKILKPEHQLFYSINGTILDFFLSPIFIWTGRNTEILTVFDGCKTFWGGPITDNYTEKILIGRPGFIHSTFGSGEVVLYSSHPDFVNNIIPIFSNDIIWEGDRYYGRRILFNTLFYVTSQKNIAPDFSFVSDVSFITLVFNKTRELLITNESINQFREIIDDMDELSSKFMNLNNTLKRIKYLYSVFLETSTFFPDNYIFSYASFMTKILRNYIDKSRSSLSMLNNIIPLISEYNESMLDNIETLKINLKNRICRAHEIVDNVISLALEIKHILESENISVLQKIELLMKRKDFSSHFSIELKYIPQLFFESEKVLRAFWYTYEAYRVMY